MAQGPRGRGTSKPCRHHCQSGPDLRFKSLLKSFTRHSPGPLPQRINAMLLSECLVLLCGAPHRLIRLAWLEVGVDCGDLGSGDWLKDVSQQGVPLKSIYPPTHTHTFISPPSLPSFLPDHLEVKQPLGHIPSALIFALPEAQGNGLTSAQNAKNSNPCKQTCKSTPLQVAFFTLT